jgi:hypothetical protein
VITVLIRRSDRGEISIYDRRDDFLASFKNGKWVDTDIFSSYELEEFIILEDESEIASVLNEARTALDKNLPNVDSGEVDH